MCIEFIDKNYISDLKKSLNKKDKSLISLEQRLIETLTAKALWINFIEPFAKHSGLIENTMYRVVTYNDGADTNLILSIIGHENGTWESKLGYDPIKIPKIRDRKDAKHVKPTAGRKTSVPARRLHK